MKLNIHPSQTPTPLALRDERVANPGFGKYFTDHMVIAKWSGNTGWSDGDLQAYGPLVLDPATLVFHYAQEIFEGMKAYRWSDGSVALFRPYENAKRFNKGATRMALPEIPEDFFVNSVEQLVSQDKAWVPHKSGEALYIRPFMFASEVAIGVRPSNEAIYCLIATPVGAYFDPKKPVTVWISTEYVRAAPGGTGEVKCGGNYAASLMAQKAAAAQGCDQVVWLDAIEKKWIEEMGGMNLFFVKGDKERGATIFTPKLTGTLLPGITRDSILTVAKDLGYQVEEGMISVDQWREGVASGEISEVFACGTAAVISIVGGVKSENGGWINGDGQSAPIAMQIREHLLGIQHGSVEDKHGWIVKVD